MRTVEPNERYSRRREWEFVQKEISIYSRTCKSYTVEASQAKTEDAEGSRSFLRTGWRKADAKTRLLGEATRTPTHSHAVAEQFRAELETIPPCSCPCPCPCPCPYFCPPNFNFNLTSTGEAQHCRPLTPLHFCCRQTIPRTTTNLTAGERPLGHFRKAKVARLRKYGRIPLSRIGSARSGCSRMHVVSTLISPFSRRQCETLCPSPRAVVRTDDGSSSIITPPPLHPSTPPNFPIVLIHRRPRTHSGPSFDPLSVDLPAVSSSVSCPFDFRTAPAPAPTPPTHLLPFTIALFDILTTLATTLPSTTLPSCAPPSATHVLSLSSTFAHHRTVGYQPPSFPHIKMPTEQRVRYELTPAMIMEAFLDHNCKLTAILSTRISRSHLRNENGFIVRHYMCDDEDGKPLGNPPPEVLKLPPYEVPKMRKTQPYNPYLHSHNEFEDRLYYMLKYEIAEMDRNAIQSDFNHLALPPMSPEREPPYMMEVRKEVQEAHPDARGAVLGELIYEATKKHIYAIQQGEAALVSGVQDESRPAPTQQNEPKLNTTTTPNEVIVIEDSPVQAHAAPVAPTYAPSSASENPQDLAVQSQLAFEEQQRQQHRQQHQQQQVRAASRPPSQNTQRPPQALQRPLPAARAATPKNATANMRYVAATTPHAPHKIMKNVPQNTARPQSRSCAPAVGAASVRVYRGQARGVPQALHASRSIDPRQFEALRQMYGQKQPPLTQAQMPVMPAVTPGHSQAGRQHISQSPAMSGKAQSRHQHIQRQQVQPVGGTQTVNPQDLQRKPQQHLQHQQVQPVGGTQTVNPQDLQRKPQQHLQHQQVQPVGGTQTVDPQDLLRKPQQQDTRQLPKHTNPDFALQQMQASRQLQTIGEQQTPTMRPKSVSTGRQTPVMPQHMAQTPTVSTGRQTPVMPQNMAAMGRQTPAMQQDAAEMCQQTPSKRQKTSSTGWQTPLMHQKTAVMGQQTPTRNQMPADQITPSGRQTPAMQQQIYQAPAMQQQMQSDQRTQMMQRHTQAMQRKTPIGQQTPTTAPMTQQQLQSMRQQMPNGQQTPMKTPAMQRSVSASQQTPTKAPAVQRGTPAMGVQMPTGQQTQVMQHQMSEMWQQIMTGVPQYQNAAMQQQMAIGQQTPLMQHQMPVTREEMALVMMQRRMQAQAQAQQMHLGQQTPMMQQYQTPAMQHHQTPAMTQHTPNGQHQPPMKKAHEREVLRQMMMRRNSSQQQQLQNRQQYQQQFQQQQYQPQPQITTPPQPRLPQMSEDEIMNQFFSDLRQLQRPFPKFLFKRAKERQGVGWTCDMIIFERASTGILGTCKARAGIDECMQCNAYTRLDQSRSDQDLSMLLLSSALLCSSVSIVSKGLSS
ncbi:uncharacterized protein MYCFIDRAFT_179089 [Pseudocercospora fijiensis CIRAD86]|uniref:Uncharacterized protein n=1 Tax=Pseudocercospora fijiensis (strain CIRAD86) TaxID=383855 RepID=M2YIG9_PSEFD|nr:uncharacterized protein MYCFIDRAFT_179089 [Pseudocercospora fijiensis CIRAD86]EME77570.1 hypothetical protein MYCFIDRAFT_179089 [Pseudocercospora fijiensis CIRAD86]